MNPHMQQLAQRYALAFIASFPSFMHTKRLSDITKCITNIRERSHVLFYLKISCIPEETRIKKLLSFLEEYNLYTPETKRLVLLLAQKKRLFLIALVLEELIMQYKKDHEIIDFIVRSSSELNTKEKDTLEKFLVNQTQAHISCTYTIDKNLIAGVRALSTTWLWEHSIAKQLRAIKYTYLM